MAAAAQNIMCVLRWLRGCEHRTRTMTTYALECIATAVVKLDSSFVLNVD